MQLIYYHGRTPNFGDDLNRVIWPALAPDLFDGNAEDGFVGIGTVIGMPVPGVHTLNVFGSGIGNNRLEQWHDKKVRYWCVRGPISARLVGVAPELAITDGALLTPLVKGYPTAAAGGGGTVVVPHWETLDHPGWDAVAVQTGFEIIDPRAELLDVVQRIARAGLVLTESLHGAIIADTYGIPWIAFATSKNFGGTKWVDWAMSLAIPFNLTMVPPPSAGPVVSFGRGRADYGRTLTLDMDDALRDFAERVAPRGAAGPRDLKVRVKTAIKQSTWLHPLLGFNPTRTAEALVKLAGTRPSLSSESVRLELRDRLLDRLDTVSVEYRAGSLAEGH
jgi:succinoglycan biosynthesis protein ExoV